MNIDLGNREITVKIIYKNNKNIYFRFDENLFLVVTCPKRTYDETIYDLIKKNEAPLLKMYDKALEKKKYDDKFWYLGKEYLVEYNDNFSEVKFLDNVVQAKDEDTLDDFIEEKIKEIFTSEANICAKCFNNLPDYKLRFRQMKTRWGVCNRKDNIVTLNKELIKKDVDLIDYVIIHEMAHFYEGNHSKDFWAIVALACPDYKKRRGRLRK